MEQWTEIQKMSYEVRSQRSRGCRASTKDVHANPVAALCLQRNLSKKLARSTALSPVLMDMPVRTNAVQAAIAVELGS